MLNFTAEHAQGTVGAFDHGAEKQVRAFGGSRKENKSLGRSQPEEFSRVFSAALQQPPGVLPRTMNARGIERAFRQILCDNIRNAMICRRCRCVIKVGH